MSEHQYPYGGFDNSDNADDFDRTEHSDNSGHVDNSGFANAEPFSASSHTEEAHSESTKSESMHSESAHSDQPRHGYSEQPHAQQPHAQQTQFNQQPQFGQQNQQQPPFGQGTGRQGFPPQGAAQPGPMQPPRPPMHGRPNKPKGFFGALFDFDFRNFVTVDFAKIIYIIAITLSSIVALGWVIFGLITFFASMRQGGGEVALGFIAFLVTIIVAAMWFFTTTILVRVQIEFIVAAIRTAQHTGEMVKHQHRTEHGERY